MTATAEKKNTKAPKTTMKEAAQAILQAEGGPMKASDITAKALDDKLIVVKGKTPEATMQAQLSVAAKQKETFLRTAPGTYGLIGRDKATKAKPKSKAAA